MSFSDVLGYAGTSLKFFLLGFLVWGPFSRYTPLFLFVAVSFLADLSQAWVYEKFGSGPQYFQVYWTGEMLNGLALILLVVSLTLRSVENSPIRASVVKFLTVISVTVLVLPFLVVKGPAFVRSGWFPSTNQWHNFGASLLSLSLWTTAIMRKPRDTQFLRVVAGLGAFVAGTSFTLGVHYFAPKFSTLRDVADWATRLTQTASVLMWCWAFWPGAAKSAQPPLTVTSAKSS